MPGSTTTTASVGKTRGPTAAAAAAVLAGCWPRRWRQLDSTLYVRQTACCARCHGCLKPADFCCSCFCCECCGCGCCECCDLRCSVCCAATWQWILGGLLGSGYAVVTALLFHYESSFAEMDTQIVALMIHLLVFWWLYFLTGIVGCCTSLDRQGILTYDPRVLYTSRLYVGLNVLCALCHVTLALLNKGLWMNPLTRINLFVTFLPLLWDWYILYLAWSLTRKLREQRKGVFRGRPVMSNQRKPGQLLELHSAHNLELVPPRNQVIVPLALGPVGRPLAPGAAALGAALRRSALGARWSAPSGDTLAYDSTVATGRDAAAAGAEMAAPPPYVMDRTSRSAVYGGYAGRYAGGGGAWNSIHARSDPSEASSVWNAADNSFVGSGGDDGGSSLGGGAAAWGPMRRQQVMLDLDGESTGAYDGDDDGGGGESGGREAEEGEVDLDGRLIRTRSPVSLPVPPVVTAVAPPPPQSMPSPALVATGPAAAALTPGLGPGVGGAAPFGGPRMPARVGGPVGLPVGQPDALAAIQEEEAAIMQRLSLQRLSAQHPDRHPGPLRQPQKYQRARQQRRRSQKVGYRRRIHPQGYDDGGGGVGGGVPLPGLPPASAQEPPQQLQLWRQQRGAASAFSLAAASPQSAVEAFEEVSLAAVFELRRLSTRPSAGCGSLASQGSALLPRYPTLSGLASPAARQVSTAAAQQCSLASGRPHNPPLPTLESVVLSVPVGATYGSALFNRAEAMGPGVVARAGDGDGGAAGLASYDDGGGDEVGTAAALPPPVALSPRVLSLRQPSVRHAYALRVHSAGTPSGSQASATAHAPPLAATPAPPPSPRPGPALAKPHVLAKLEPPRHSPGGSISPLFETAVWMADSDMEVGPEERLTPPTQQQRRTPATPSGPGSVRVSPGGDTWRPSNRDPRTASVSGPGHGFVHAAPPPPAADGTDAGGIGRRSPQPQSRLGGSRPSPSAAPLPPPPLPPVSPQLRLSPGRQRPYSSEDGMLPLPPLPPPHLQHELQNMPPGLPPWPQPDPNGVRARRRDPQPSRSVYGGSSGGASDGVARSDGGGGVGGAASDGGGGGGTRPGGHQATSSAKALRGVGAWTAAATAAVRLPLPPSSPVRPSKRTDSAAASGGARTPPLVPLLPLQQLRPAVDPPTPIYNHPRAQSYSAPSYQPAQRARQRLHGASVVVASAGAGSAGGPSPRAGAARVVWPEGAAVEGSDFGGAAMSRNSPRSFAGPQMGSGGAALQGGGGGGGDANYHYQHPEYRQQVPYSIELPPMPPPPPQPTPLSVSSGHQHQPLQQQPYPHSQHLRQQQQQMQIQPPDARASGGRSVHSTRFWRQQQQQQQQAVRGNRGSGGGAPDEGAVAAPGPAAGPAAALGGLVARASASAAVLWGAISGDWRSQPWADDQSSLEEAPAPADARAATKSVRSALPNRVSFWAAGGPSGGAGGARGGGGGVAASVAAAVGDGTSPSPSHGSVHQPVGGRPRAGGSLPTILSPLGLPAVASAARDGATKMYDMFVPYVGRAVRGASEGSAAFWAGGRSAGAGGTPGGAVDEEAATVAATVFPGKAADAGGGSSGGDGSGAATPNRSPVTPVAEITPFPDDPSN